MPEDRRHSLTATVNKLRQKIQQIRDRKETVGEQNTKAALIEPLLAALGWDVGETDEVCREYKPKRQDNPVDYALFLLRSPRLFVEAKGLGKDLGDRRWISQTVAYANRAGVEWCVLTNGDEYRIYNVHAPVDVEEKLFRTIRLSDSGQEPFTLETLELLSKEKLAENLLNVLWRFHFVDRKLKAAVEDLFKSEDAGLVRLLRRQTTGLRPSDIHGSIKRALVRVEFPLAAVPKPPEADRSPSRPAKKKRTIKRKQPAKFEVGIGDLIRAGMLQAPLKLEREYKGARLRATIEQDGTVTFDDKPYDSLSTAGGMARKSVVGAPAGRPYPQTNGWTFWKYRDPETAKLLEVDSLRKKYLMNRASTAAAGGGIAG